MKISESGQVMLIILMVMIIALAAGVAMSQKLLMGYRRSINLDSSSRALSVAESALEKVLTYSTTQLDGYITNNNCGTNCQLTITGTDAVPATAQVTLGYFGNSNSQVDVTVKKDETFELLLNGYSGTAPIEFCWDNVPSGNNPSVVVNHVNYSSGYQLTRYAYNSAITQHSFNGFNTATSDLTYPNCFTASAKTDSRLLRVRAIYNDVSLHVIPKNGAALPIQGYLLTATGTMRDVTRTVKVVKTKPYLPSSFDFALFSTSNDTPLR